VNIYAELFKKSLVRKAESSADAAFSEGAKTILGIGMLHQRIQA
jgi:hypothetical protein